MTKIALVSYNEAIDAEVMEALDACGLKNYTKITGVFGRGATSGVHLGNDVWPGRNNLLYVACQDIEAKKLLESLRKLKASLGKEGVKAFILPVDELI